MPTHRPATDDPAPLADAITTTIDNLYANNDDRYPECPVCTIPFTNDNDWDNRHTDSMLSDFHPECCDICQIANA